jgi:hypothetical protein
MLKEKIQMNKVLSIFILLFLTGCATTTKDVSPAQSFRPKGSEDLWRITGHIDSEFKQGLMGDTVSRILNVYINGTLAIKGGLSPKATGELIGKYEEHDIVSICASELKAKNWIEVRCTILVDNERAATLTF